MMGGGSFLSIIGYGYFITIELRSNSFTFESVNKFSLCSFNHDFLAILNHDALEVLTNLLASQVVGRSLRC